MSRSVFTFWQTPEDESEFLAYLTKKNAIALPATALPPGNANSDPLRRYIETTPRPDAGLTQERFLRLVEFSHDNAGKARVDAMNSPVLNYSPGAFRGTTLVPANLYAYWSRLEMTPLRSHRKDPEFVKWGHSIFAWLRKHAPIRTQLLPMTRCVEQLFNQQSLTLATY